MDKNQFERIRESFYRDYNELVVESRDDFLAYYRTEINQFLNENAEEYPFFSSITELEFSDYVDAMEDEHYSCEFSLAVQVKDGTNYNYVADEDFETNQPIFELYQYLVELIDVQDLRLVFSGSATIVL